jgi:hypothetical protein
MNRSLSVIGKCERFSSSVISALPVNRFLVELLSLFPTETVEERINNWYSSTKQVKHMIPVTWETIYNTMHPLYEQTYLKNGKEYQKHYGY